MHSVHTQRASSSVQATYVARNAGRLRAVRPGLQAGRAAGGKGTAAQSATEQQRVSINNVTVERDVPVSEPWIPRAWLSPNTAVLLRQLQVAASALLQQRLQGHSTSPPSGQLTGPGQRLLQPDHEVLVNQLGARLQHQAPAAAAGQDPLVSALQQLREQVDDRQWAAFTSTVQSAAAAALANSHKAGAAAAAAAGWQGAGEALDDAGHHPSGVAPAHQLHDHHPVPPLLATLASLEEELCDALGEVHGYGRNCSSPDALSIYHPGYSPLHQELAQESPGDTLYTDLPAHLLQSSWYGQSVGQSWADPHTAAGWRRRQQHQQQQTGSSSTPADTPAGGASDGTAAAGEADVAINLNGRHPITALEQAPYMTAISSAAAKAADSSSHVTVGTSGSVPAAAAGHQGTGYNTVSRKPFAQYEHLVFGGGGARCLAYAGALHSLRTLGLVGRLKSVSGASGGAVYALLAALGLSVQEVLEAMSSLPDHEPLSWWQLNSRLGLTDGEATFEAIHQAVSKRLGKRDPTLGDVQAASGIIITLTATSLARRGPVYLSSDTHPDLPVMVALRSSCAIPLLFAPVRGPGGDLLVDGCISDCTPVGGLGPGVDPSRVLVLAVHDANGLEAPDLTGLVSGLVATCMQAGYHQLKALGVDVLNLWPSVAGVNPLNFRVPRDQARDVVAASQALAEAFAVERMAPQAQVIAPTSAADQPPAPSASSSGPAAAAASAATQPHTDLRSAVEQQSSLALEFSSSASSSNAVGRPFDVEDLLQLPSEPHFAAVEAEEGKVLVGASGASQHPMSNGMPAGLLDSTKQQHQQLVAGPEHVGQVAGKASRRKVVGHDDNWWHPWGESVATGYGYEDL